MNLINQLQTLHQLLDDDSQRSKKDLFRIENNKIVTPIANDAFSLFSHRSRRRDEFRNMAIIESIINKVKSLGQFRGLNHIGFCYKVSSKANEAQRLTNIAKSKGYPIYREPSSDDGDWLFVGDISNPDNFLLEFIPHEGEADKWINHWLPHVQFDVDTGLAPEEIETIIKEFINEPGTPYSIQIDGVTYIQRINLGCIEGINVFLDLATNNRNPEYRKTWIKLGE